MLCALRLLGGSKFTQIHNVGCHLPPCRAAVAGLEGGYIYVFSFIIYFNCCRQLTYKHPFRTPRPLETHTSARHHKSACQPPHHKGAEQIGRGTRAEWRREGRQESRRGDGGWSSLVSHRKGRKGRKASYCTGFASFAAQYFINNIF